MARTKAMKVNRGRKKKSFWGVLALFAAAISISLGIAAVWQASAGEIPPPDKTEHRGLPAQSKPDATPAPTLKPTPSPSPTPEPTPSMPVSQGAVPESEPVDESYFDDAVFVGDSITEGMLIYGGLGNAAVLAGRGINFSTVEDSAVVMQEDGSKISIMEGLRQKQYGKVYVMLGGNEVANDKSFFLQRYEKVLDQIIALQPEAVVYVQSMTPVTRHNNYDLDNARIDEYNAALLELCRKKGLYYVNVAEALKDEQGYLPDEASPADGMHFATDTFQKWYAYLKNHTVSPQTPAAQGSSPESSPTDEDS